MPRWPCSSSRSSLRLEQGDRSRSIAAIALLGSGLGSDRSGTWSTSSRRAHTTGHIDNTNADYSLHGWAGLIAIPARYLIDFAEVPGAVVGGLQPTPPRAAACRVVVRQTADLVDSINGGSRGGARSPVPRHHVRSGHRARIPSRSLSCRQGRIWGFSGTTNVRSLPAAMTSFYGHSRCRNSPLPDSHPNVPSRSPPYPLALSAAPLLFLTALTLTLGYGVFNGRFFIFLDGCRRRRMRVVPP